MAGNRIVLVDDHAILRDCTAQLLESGGFRIVGCAGTGVEAIDLAERLDPDAMTMDITMPDMDGIEATRIIKKYWPNIRIIALSMHEGDYMEAAMKEAGADAYLSKHVAVEMLVDTLRGVLDDAKAAEVRE